MARATRTTWAQRIEAWNQSGLSAAEFAAKLGVRPRTLSWWAWRLASRRPRKGKPTAIEVRHDRTTVAPLTFVEMTGALGAEPIEIVLRNDLRVRVHATFDERALARVLDVLERR